MRQSDRRSQYSEDRRGAVDGAVDDRSARQQRGSRWIHRPLKSMLDRTALGFEQMNTALKTKAESSRVAPA
jgi:hypothetical protein